MSNAKLFRPSAGQATELQNRALDQKKTFANADREIKVMTMKVSKGLESPVVALAGVGYMPAKGVDEQEAARVFYVAATRVTQRLVIGVGGDGGGGGRRLNFACCSLSSNAQPAEPRKIPANEHSTKFANAINLILNGPSNI